jgi:hypothetical protein
VQPSPISAVSPTTTPMAWSKNTRSPIFGARMDLDTGEPAPDMGHKAPHPLEAVVPEPVGAPVQHQRVQARITGQHLPGAAGSRVAVEDALDVGAQARKHGLSLAFWPVGLFLRQHRGPGRRHTNAAQNMDFFLAKAAG